MVGVVDDGSARTLDDVADVVMDGVISVVLDALPPKAAPKSFFDR